MAESLNPSRQAERAGQKASSMINKIRDSEYGKMIPTELQDVTLHMMIRFALFAKLGYFFPTYLIVTLTSEPETGILHHIVAFIKSIAVLVCLADFTLQAVIGLAKIKILYAVMLLSMVIKNGFLITITFCYLVDHWSFFCAIMWLLYTAANLGIDLVFVYYIGVRFNMLTEDEANNNVEDVKEDAKEAAEEAV
ncbi:hypothetical protein PAPHI01_1790 [Pancytospora philotis]|nr:hypothetical protein PAPHI01_1790 [Pancytospora philotis]